jgi:hypothetical protein
MNLQDAIMRFRTFFRRPSQPTPRWQILVASFYLGMLIYLLMYQYGIV